MIRPAGAVGGDIPTIAARYGNEAMRADLDALLPALRERRDETRENRTILLEIREMLRASGVARILQPTAYGGAGGRMLYGLEIDNTTL